MEKVYVLEVSIGNWETYSHIHSVWPTIELAENKKNEILKKVEEMKNSPCPFFVVNEDGSKRYLPSPYDTSDEIFEDPWHEQYISLLSIEDRDKYYEWGYTINKAEDFVGVEILEIELCSIVKNYFGV